MCFKPLCKDRMSLDKYIHLIKDVIMPLTQKTAQLLAQKTHELETIQWTDGEANTDTEFSMLACKMCQEAWTLISPQYPSYFHLTLEAKHPDINLCFLEMGSPVKRGKIELKSTKTKSGIMPGSTIGKLDMNQPVIFCLRNDTNKVFEFRYGQYYNCIGENEYDMFQDRTPRPAVNFQKMTPIDTPLTYHEKEKGVWIPHYAKCALRRIQDAKCKSWQDDLTKNILHEYISQTSVEDFVRAKEGQEH